MAYAGEVAFLVAAASLDAVYLALLVVERRKPQRAAELPLVEEIGDLTVVAIEPDAQRRRQALRDPAS